MALKHIIECICCVCKEVYGYKLAELPYSTHGFCPDCFEKEMKKLREEYGNELRGSIIEING